MTKIFLCHPSTENVPELISFYEPFISQLHKEGFECRVDDEKYDWENSLSGASCGVLIAHHSIWLSERKQEQFNSIFKSHLDNGVGLLVIVWQKDTLYLKNETKGRYSMDLSKHNYLRIDITKPADAAHRAFDSLNTILSKYNGMLNIQSALMLVVVIVVEC